MSSDKKRCKLCGCVLSKGKRLFCDDRCRIRYHEENPRKVIVFNILKKVVKNNGE